MNSPDVLQGGFQLVRGNILGTAVSAVDMPRVLDFVASRIADRRREYICVVPAQTVMDGLADPAFQRIVKASGRATPDSMSIIWLPKLQGYSGVGWVYGPVLPLAACQFGVAYSWGHFFYGLESTIDQTLGVKLAEQFPGPTGG